MKYLFFCFCILLSSLTLAQQSGKITYEEKMDLHKSLPADRQEMKDMIPQFRSSFSELVYSGDKSIYQRQKEAEDTEVNVERPGERMTMRFGGRDMRVVYKDLAENNMIDSREFMQKQFLIKGPPTPRKWKIGTKQKEILGYMCLEANFQADSNTSLVAWFTPQLPVSNGPADFQGLPGMILQVDTNNGTRTVTATEITMDNADTASIIAPTKGKEVTAEEFDKIREEKMKEMGGPGSMQGGGGGRHMIMIRE